MMKQILIIYSIGIVMGVWWYLRPGKCDIAFKKNDKIGKNKLKKVRKITCFVSFCKLFLVFCTPIYFLVQY